MKQVIIALMLATTFVACQRESGTSKAPLIVDVEQNYLNDPLILPIAKEYYQGRKPTENVQTLDMLDSLFSQDSVRLRFYFAATTKLIGQQMNFREIVSLYAFKFVRDRPLEFISQFSKDNPLLESNNGAWDVWCLNVGYEAIMKDSLAPFQALDVIEQNMKARFRTVSPNAMELGATFIANTRAKIIKLQNEPPRIAPPKEALPKETE
ncbi:hypothetical protein BH09BAC1_BH09BAC1_19880 [soil metagenome]